MWKSTILKANLPSHELSGRSQPPAKQQNKTKQTKQLPFVLVDHQNEMIITKDIAQFISAHKDLKLQAELEASPAR